MTTNSFEDKQLSIFNGDGEYIKTMTITEVSYSLSVTSKTVRKYVDKLFPGKMEHGKITYLNEKEATAIKLELEKNHHLNQSVSLPKTELEKELLVQQALLFQSEKIERLTRERDESNAKLEEARPKIDFHDHVETSINSISVAEFANLLTKNGYKIGQNLLFKWFYKNKYLISSNRPYQKSLDNEWFEMAKITFSDNYGCERTAHKTMVTGKGQTFFTKKIKGTTVENSQ